jgi:hypothetical protein
VSTPSHGGWILSPDRQAHLAALDPAFTTWAGAPYYEEDCDWAAPCLVFGAEVANTDSLVVAADMLCGSTDPSRQNISPGWAALRVQIVLENDHGGELIDDLIALTFARDACAGHGRLSFYG